MKALTYTLYKKHRELYTEIHGSIAANSCQIDLNEKDIILLSNVPIVVYKAGKPTAVENNKFIHFNLSAGTCLIDYFNAKIEVAILQKRQDWKPPQIKDLNWSYQNTTHLWPQILFLSGLVYPTTILKRSSLLIQNIP